MAYENEKQRLYQKIAELTGISRKIDPRLEKIAEDRALEARYQVGTTGSTPIAHPLDQLKARTWPLQGTYKGVWENALWHYYPPVWVDPIDAIIDGTLPSGEQVGWWHSPVHRANLTNLDATTQGLGLFKVSIGSMADRWYAVHIFTKDLNMDVVVVNGKNFPDALAAGPFAASLGAPILLVEPNRIPAPTMAYLEEFVIARIFIIGGEGAVSTGVANLLAAQANETIRIAGPDRYATAAAVARSDG